MQTNPMTKRISPVAAVAILVMSAVTSLTGCVASGEYPFGGSACMPPQYSVSPSVASPGSDVVVSAPGATCNPRYGEEAQIAVTVTDSSGNVVLDSKGPMNDDGSFEFSFALPEDMASGTATITAVPADVDWCDDTGTNNRHKSEDDIDRTSCVLPIKLLQVTP
ncbi:hypothetical protein [Glutamicibacter sp. NPDC087344]|uniref:hypothetical protein n=1 Tax=Glutamicibacter sp. NPDC087344 TaxID=3363994 RepID=UPI0038257401